MPFRTLGTCASFSATGDEVITTAVHLLLLHNLCMISFMLVSNINVASAVFYIAANVSVISLERLLNFGGDVVALLLLASHVVVGQAM